MWQVDAAQYNERFKFVTQEMNQAVNSHPDLRDHARSISYTHKMVGSSPAAARPCIIVFCSREHFKPLRQLFNDRLKSPLYCSKPPLATRLRGQKGSVAPVPPFELIYYRYPVKAKGASTGNSPSPITAATWCGARVQSGSQAATLGLTVGVGNLIGVITVDHIFPRDS